MSLYSSGGLYLEDCVWSWKQSSIQELQASDVTELVTHELEKLTDKDKELTQLVTVMGGEVDPWVSCVVSGNVIGPSEYVELAPSVIIPLDARDNLFNCWIQTIGLTKLPKVECWKWFSIASKYVK